MEGGKWGDEGKAWWVEGRLGKTLVGLLKGV